MRAEKKKKKFVEMKQDLVPPASRIRRLVCKNCSRLAVGALHLPLDFVSLKSTTASSFRISPDFSAGHTAEGQTRKKAVHSSVVEVTTDRASN